MSDEQINIAIAEACNVKPVLVEWWAFKDDGKGGSICFQAQTKDEVEKWIAGLPKNSWAKDYVPKAFYRYPDYCNDLNAMHEAEKTLLEKQRAAYGESLYWMYEIGMRRASCKFGRMKYRMEFEFAISSSRERAEAFLKTIGKWEDGE